MTCHNDNIRDKSWSINTTPYNIQKYLEESTAHQDANTRQSTRIDSKQLILKTNKVVHGP